MEPAPPIRVIVDDRPLRRTLTGVGNYIAQLLTHFPTYAPQFRLEPFVFTHLRHDDWRTRAATTPAPQPPSAAQPGVNPPQSAAQPRDLGDARRPWWMRRTIQGCYGTAFRWKTFHRYTLYHEPNHVPVRSDLPTVTTIHDLSVLVHPEWHPADRVKWYEADFARGLRMARHFIAASEFTRREMVARLNIPAERITVTYQAPRAAFTADRDRAAAGLPDGPASNGGESFAEATRVESLPNDGSRPLRLGGIDVPERFFLYVGTLEPRKNVTGLLEAYAALPPPLRKHHPLLIAGAWGWKAGALRDALQRHALAGDVRLLGYLHDPQLASLYRRCTALVWPTWYEGFGLPPVEAMACGAAVIVSNVASLPEVAGDAGVLLDPGDAPAWSEAMRCAAEDDAHRAACRSRSIAQAARFTWQGFVQSTAQAYTHALELPHQT